METPILDRPIPESSAPWPLSAPESYVLLHGPRATSVEAFKRGLLASVDLDLFDLGWLDKLDGVFDAVGDTGSGDGGGGGGGWSDGDGGGGSDGGGGD